MAGLVASLVTLRAEFNTMFPGRDKGSDGWIGDAAHQSRGSDHNPDSRGLVHAIDVDKDLRGGVPMQDVVDLLIRRCRAGSERRLTYVIYNRRIASASQAWAWRAYTGSNPHTEHAHFSASNIPARENDRSPWHLEEVPVALTAADKQWLSAEIRRAVRELLTADADPSSRVYSLGGMVTAVENRTADLANRQVPEIRQRLAELEARLAG